MLISYNKKFIFIHNRKVAGQSIKSALKDYGLNSPSKLHNLNKITEHHRWLRSLNTKLAKKIDLIPSFNAHITALELKNELPEKTWNSFFKFAFVRNPWDLQVSLYYYMINNKKHFRNEEIVSIKTFEKYIELIENQNRQMLQKEIICDKNDKILLDFLGKYENLESDFNKIIKKIGIKASLPHINKSNHQNYRKYYNNKTKYIVGEVFKKDIELFDYDF